MLRSDILGVNTLHFNDISLTVFDFSFIKDVKLLKGSNMGWESMLIGAITAGAAIISHWMTQRFEEKRFRHRTKEWFLDHILPMKIRAVTEVDERMTECYDNIVYYGNAGIRDMETYNRQIQDKLDAFEKSKMKADIWLRKEVIESLNKAMGALRAAAFALYLKLPEEQLPPNVQPKSYPQEIREIDWGKLGNCYENAKLKLKEAIHMEVLERYEHEIDKF